MKGKKLLIGIFLFILIISTCYITKAVEVTEYSKRFEEWLALPEEERKGTIAPIPFNVRGEVSKGIINRAKNFLKSVTIPSKYDLREVLEEKRNRIGS